MQNVTKQVCNVWVFSLVSLFFLLGTNTTGKRASLEKIKDDLVFSQSELDDVDKNVLKMGLKRTHKVFYSNASWYGEHFQGQTTANNEVYDKDQFTAAHKTLALNTYLLVTNLNNQRKLIVRINDRGPYVEGRDVDLSEAAARFLGAQSRGVVPVKYEILANSF